MKQRPLTAIAIATVFVLGACGSDDDTTTANTQPTADTTTADTTTADTDAAPPSADADVAVATDATLGEYLVDADGLTLYLFEQDQGTTTACTGPCADNWPPIVAEGTPVAGDGIDAGQLGTADGILPNQITYHGHLLYYFAGDQAPGDTNGVGLPDWYAVDPDGNAIDLE